MSDDQGSVDAGNPEAAVVAPVVAPVASEAPANWVSGFEDRDLASYAETKGFQNTQPENVVNSYRNLEKLMGADKAGRTITLLGDDATPEQRGEFYGKLGRPDAADGYTFKLDDGADTTRLDAMRARAHDLGITDAQFSGIAQADLEYLGTVVQNKTDADAMSAVDAAAALKKEWGAAYESKVTGVDLAAEKLGFTTEHLEGLRASMGPVEAMKFVDKLNSQMGDHDFDGGEAVMPNHKTPEQARQEMGELTMQKEFMDAWLDKGHPGHSAAVEKKAQLSRLITGVA